MEEGKDGKYVLTLELPDSDRPLGGKKLINYYADRGEQVGLVRDYGVVTKFEWVTAKYERVHVGEERFDLTSRVGVNNG